MTRKIVAFALAALMIVTACGISLAEDVPTIRVYMFNGEMPDSKLVQEAVSKVVYDKIGCNVELVWAGANGYFGGLSLALASNEQMDVVFDHSGSGWYDRSKDGAYADLTELLELTPTLKNSLADYIWAASTVNGKITLVSTYKDMSIEYGYFVDQADVDASGLDVASVEKVEDLEPLAAYLKNKGDDAYVFRAVQGAGTGITNTSMLVDFYEVYNGGFVSSKDDPATILNYYLTDEYEATVRMIYDWAQLGYIPADAATRDSSSYNVTGTGTNYGMSFCQYCPLSEYSLSEAYGATVGYIPVSQAVVTTDSLTGVGYCIPEKSEYKEYAIKYIELLSCDHEVADILNYGVEGVHFNYDENGDVVRVANYTSLYNPSQFAMGDIRGRSPLASEPDNKVEEYEAWNAKAIESPYIGFRIDNSAFESYQANIDAVISQYKLLFDVGALNPDEYLDEFRTELKNAGVETVIAELQNQYNDWAANK